jgi:hypothetical protein
MKNVFVLTTVALTLLITGCSSEAKKYNKGIEKRVLRLEIFEVDRQSNDLKIEVEEFGCSVVDFFWQINADEYKRIKDRSVELEADMEAQVDSQVRGHLKMLNDLDCEEEFSFGEGNSWLNPEPDYEEFFQEMEKDFLDMES